MILGDGVALKCYDMSEKERDNVMSFLEGLPISVEVDPNRATNSVERLHVVPGNEDGCYVMAPCFGDVFYEGIGILGSDCSVGYLRETGRVGFRISGSGIEMKILATKKE